jgi:hypothetical protein
LAYSPHQVRGKGGKQPDVRSNVNESPSGLDKPLDPLANRSLEVVVFVVENALSDVRFGDLNPNVFGEEPTREQHDCSPEVPLPPGFGENTTIFPS